MEDNKRRLRAKTNKITMKERDVSRCKTKDTSSSNGAKVLMLRKEGKVYMNLVVLRL